MLRRSRRAAILIAGLVAFGLACAAYSLNRRSHDAAALEEAGRTLHRLISQRVDQHDAHLTSLSALVQAAEPAPVATVEQVAASIVRFYPRIVGIDVVDLALTPPRSLLDAADPAVVAEEARQAIGSSLRLRALGGDKLLIVKRALTDGVGHYALALIIDMNRLSASDTPLPEGTRVQLQLIEQGRALDEPAGAFSADIASRTQPLRLTLTTSAPGWPLPPPAVLMLAGLLIGLATFLVDRLLEARSAAREAARKAVIAEQDARLAHAGRVNAMGELASGIAHELTQPLTAILGQAQAGRRLLAQPDADQAVLAGAFEAIARNARRAGDILGRLRAWISKSEPQVESVDLTELAGEVVDLLAANAQAVGATLCVTGDGSRPLVRADRVQLEQVVFNLARNGLEAVEGLDGERRVTIEVGTQGGEAVLAVHDSGPGLSSEAQARLFEPFFTTKPAGLGLGLALCVRLVERFDGTLAAENAAEGGAVFSVRLPRVASEASREATE
ncbi:Phospho-acceptor domain-containing protein [Bosea sp. 62]|uniref:sensor histidine kinase n=1 Tax=unclassified Bosea (in: a-proteobacteria) TaxID=2653178 RepID=UPI00125AD272|nr:MULTISPECIES: ATP-binding protein [unclassified Bosea (in: a-proteobacteria)]CAD5288069.1 Phospho-acceptor domain-containing protein [Bosea sp. 21B]CAD5290349.1 Phospho-acceptor domain-containing protein [Bosea sp. 46]CAD5300926.1 Phospho-acceptor domain-containing protein [Bosea sp. 7B]VVT60392.1 His Kinase A (Phospho-acceptor) domain-containing protein [Bosea sp. EC-HK365B]VXA98514.1 Phospho-acceptor domain-containing protein [Bosea sp. 62]